MRIHRYRLSELCLRKKRHPDEPTARAMAMCSCAKFERDVMSIYSCRHCGGYHITSQPGVLANRVTATVPFLGG